MLEFSPGANGANRKVCEKTAAGAARMRRDCGDAHNGGSFARRG